MPTKKKPKPKRAKSKKLAVPKLDPNELMVRTSERLTFKRCRFQWDLDYRQRLKPLREQPALRFGTLIHAALEERYPKGIKRGAHPARAFEKLYDADLAENEEHWKNFDAENEEWVEARELGIDMLEGYVERYGRDEEWEVIESEMTFKTPVYIPDHMLVPDGPDSKIILADGREIKMSSIFPDWKPGQPLFYYVGTMDGVWRNRQDARLRIVDYKTTSGDAKKEAEAKSSLDEQGTAYWTWGCDYLIDGRILKPRDQESLDGMLYVFLKKSKRDTRPVNDQGQSLNKDGSVSKTQPAPRLYRKIVYRGETEREMGRVRAVQEVVEMQMIRVGLLAAYKNPETGSKGHCSWCSYRDVCEMHESGADWEMMRDSTMEVWNPYDAHEIKEGDQRS